MAVGERDADEAQGGADDGRMTVVEHLAELRGRLIKAVLAVAVGAVVGFALYEPILEVLRRPYCEVSAECDFIVTNPLESFSIRMKLSGYAGLLLASPVVLWQLWRFVTPGLYAHEKRYAVPFVLSAVALFVSGASLALWTFPNALRFLQEIGGEPLDAFYTPGAYLSLVTFMMLAFGVGFLFPVLLVFLQLARVLTPRRLAGWRRYAVVIVFVIVALITPSGDPFTLLALAGPMVLFYEASILIGWIINRRRQ